MIADEIKVSSLTVVPSLGETDALYRRVFPSGNGDIVAVLTEEIPPHPYLLPIVLADYFQVVSEVAFRATAVTAGVIRIPQSAAVITFKYMASHCRPVAFEYVLECPSMTGRHPLAELL